MGESGPHITVAENDRQRGAFYSIYPDGIAGTCAEDLRCPYCNGEEIFMLEELKQGNDRMTGNTAKCWDCKRKFIITGKCWKTRQKNGHS